MFYPKEFEKDAAAFGEIAEKVAEPFLKTIRRAIRIKDIATHTPPTFAPVTMPNQTMNAPSFVPVTMSDQTMNAPAPSLYIDDNGRVYPTVFGYQIPVDIIPRKLKPIIRNISDSEPR